MNIVTIVFASLIILIYLCNKLGVKNLELKIGNINIPLFEWIKLEFFPNNQNQFLIKAEEKIGFVISSNGQIYKIHLVMTVKPPVDTSLNNVSLFISGIGWFVLRRFFQEGNGGRIPHKENKLLDAEKVKEIGVEFEKQEGWEPLDPKQKVYEALLSVSFLDEEVSRKFLFKIRKQNIDAINIIKNQKRKNADIIEVPIIRN